MGDDRSTRRPSGRQHPLDQMIDAVGLEGADVVEDAVALDPDRPAGVDHHLVDVRIAQVHVEFTQSAQSGERRVGEQFLVGHRAQGRQMTHLLDHQRTRVTGPVGDAPADLRHRGDVVVDDGRLDRFDELGGERHAAARRSSFEITRGGRVASSPASTARATAGSKLTVATTGTPRACSTSRRDSARPGSATSTTPVGRVSPRTARRSAR